MSDIAKVCEEIAALLDGEEPRQEGEIDSRQYAEQMHLTRASAWGRLIVREEKGLLTSRYIKENGKTVRVFRLKNGGDHGK